MDPYEYMDACDEAERDPRRAMIIAAYLLVFIMGGALGTVFGLMIAAARG